MANRNRAVASPSRLAGRQNHPNWRRDLRSMVRADRWFSCTV